ncbi:MAG: discoidin domain-containing protein [Kiritimatiellia bacterium]
MKTSHSVLWKWCASIALAAGLGMAALPAQADVYLGRDGGLEGTAIVDNSQTNPPTAGKWTKNNLTQTIAEETTVVRSGSKSVRLFNSATTARRTWTPLVSFDSKTTAVTIQYYRLITNSTSCQTNQVGVLRATESLQGSYGKPASIDTWEKKTYSPSSATFSSIAGVIMHRASSSGAGDMYVDDLCIYDGSADTVAPPIAGALTVATNSATALDLSWAASADVDGGGYLVVRYASSPDATDDPNANGIYATNNVVAGSVNGMVVYQGDGLSFTDGGLTTDQTYYYKLYTYDKAYNYSAETEGSGMPAEEGSVVVPTLTSPTATSIGPAAATLGATIASDGGDALTERGTVYDVSANPTANGASEGGTATGAFSHERTGLSQGAHYYYRGYAVNSAGTGYSPDGSFYTEPGQASGVAFNDVADTAMEITWQGGADGDGAIVVVRAGNADVADPTDGTLHDADAAFGGGADLGNGSYVVYRGEAATNVTVTGLSSETTYYVEVFAYKGTAADSGVDQGINYRQASPATGNQTTELPCEPDAPTGLYANPTNYVDFTANWSAADRATGYRLDVSEEEEFSTSVPASDLIISEYFEGVSGNNKAVEIYNGTGASVDLSNYRLWQISNGGSWPESTNYPSGILAPGEVYVVIHSSADYPNLTGAADLTSGTLNFNGDDAVGLAKNVEGTWTLIDAVGEEGADPGDGWTVAGTALATKDHSLIRKSTVTGPTTNWAVSRGTSAEDSQWIVSAGGTNEHAANFGSHAFDGGSTPSFVAGFENLAVAGTSASVTGLTDNTTYYFRVRAEGEGGCPSENSATASVTTRELLKVQFNKAGVNVREAGEGRFFARLNMAPASAVTVAVARVSGDEGIALQGPASIVFKPADWFAWRRVTLEAAADENTAGETATFEASGAGVGSASIEATTLDDDGLDENIASSETTLAGSRAGALPQAVDGTHNSSTNYAYTLWTNPAQGYITMDLGRLATVSRVRLLNWDWDNRYHRYTVESSSNGTDWTTLLDASGTDRQGWDDWALSSQNLRYLRFTGLSNTVNKGICVAEWEVYGTRPPLPQPVIMATNVLVRENGEGRFYVRLDQAPSAAVAVSVTRSAGDAGIAVQAGSETVTFDPADWAEWRPVTLEAAEDGNSANETATFLLSGSGTADQTVDAVALDDDIGENLALASGGTVASGTRVGRPAQVNDGVHTVSTNYAYTFWSNAPQGTLTLDLQAASTVSRVRLLNWDWDERSHRYTIESSLDGTSWATLIDASGEDCQGWDDWAVEDESIRYLRFTGLTNSVDKGICVAEWEVYGERILSPLVEFSKAEALVRENGEGRFFVRLSRAPADDVTVAVAHSAGDADLSVQNGGSLTFTPANWSAWQAVTLAAADDEDADDGTATFQATTAGEDPQEMAAAELDDDSGTNLALAGKVTGGSRGAQAIDGIHATSVNYAYVNSTSVPPGSLKLDLKASKTISRIRVLNWDWTYRVHRYTIESSANGVDWTPLVDASGEDHQGWDEWTVDATARFLRLTGLSNSANYVVCIPEWEVYGPVARRAPAPAKAVDPQASSPTVASAESAAEALTVVTSDDVAPVYESGWAALDGNPETAWIGQKAGGGYILVEFGPALDLSGLEVDLAEGSLADVEYLYSADAAEWKALPEDLEANPVSLNFLWLLFPDDGTEAVPNVIEIRPNP